MALVANHRSAHCAATATVAYAALKRADITAASSTSATSDTAPDTAAADVERTSRGAGQVGSAGLQLQSSGHFHV
jgi:hypothetical protein